MKRTHLIVDEGQPGCVGLALEFITYDCERNLDQFIQKVPDSWNWDREKKEKVFKDAMAIIEQDNKTEAPATAVSKKPRTTSQA